MDNETPTTDAEWLEYADRHWDDIARFNGLDPSFVGAYDDESAISYAQAFAGVDHA